MCSTRYPRWNFLVKIKLKASYPGSTRDELQRHSTEKIDSRIELNALGQKHISQQKKKKQVRGCSNCGCYFSFLMCHVDVGGEWMWADSAPRYLDTAGRRLHLGCAGREVQRQGIKNDGKNVLFLLQQRIKQKKIPSNKVYCEFCWDKEIIVNFSVEIRKNTLR